jgi:hypothetical protein
MGEIARFDLIDGMIVFSEHGKYVRHKDYEDEIKIAYEQGREDGYAEGYDDGFHDGEYESE